MKKSRFLVSLIVLSSFVLVLGTVSLLISCMSPFGWGGSYNYDSNGERIYFTATSSSGQPITYSGSIRMMHSITCANCHGPEGRGGRVTMMMSYFDAPDITWDNLTEAGGHSEETGKDEHDEHPPYTEETLKRAITRGIDPAEDPLDDIMPRWRMTESDLSDLVEFIKTLD